MWYEYWECIGRAHIDRKRDQFTTIGTNVNLASRIESVATEDQIVVSPSTKMCIDNKFNLTTVPIEKAIKGFENISECYEITSKKERAVSFNNKDMRKGKYGDSLIYTSSYVY